MKKVYEDDRYLVVILESYPESVEYCKKTTWCTAFPKDSSYWFHYTSRGGELFVITRKSDGYMWQCHPQSGEFRNEFNLTFNIDEDFPIEEAKGLREWMDKTWNMDVVWRYNKFHYKPDETQFLKLIAEEFNYSEDVVDDILDLHEEFMIAKKTFEGYLKYFGISKDIVEKMADRYQDLCGKKNIKKYDRRTYENSVRFYEPVEGIMDDPAASGEDIDGLATRLR